MPRAREDVDAIVVDVARDLSRARAIASDRADGETLRAGERVGLLPKAWFDGFARATLEDGTGRPAMGPIDVTHLLAEDAGASGGAVARAGGRGEDEAALRPALREGEDFEIVRASAMETLESWYGHAEGSRTIYRTCVERGGGVYVDVYGLTLRARFGDESRAVELPRGSEARELVRAMKAAFEELRDVSEDDIRVSDYLFENRGEVLTNAPKKSLEDFHLLPDQLVLVETKTDGRWPDEGESVIALPSMSDNDDMDHTSLGCDVSLTPKNDVSTCVDAAKVGTRGKAGLSNLGNTCFMNSALQCLSHSSLLTDYFLSDKYEADINTENPIGMGGELANEYANLIGALWRDGALTVTPRKFKYSLARFAPQFSGYMQQDAQELLAFLLDGLHEDLNRVKKKPYIEEHDAEGRTDEDVAQESWEAHLSRNDSVIVDTFQGQYRSTLVCPTCSHKSVKFDPFMYLSVPVPSTRERVIKVTLLSYGDEMCAVTYGLTLSKSGDLASLLSALCEVADVDTMAERIVLCEVYNHRLEKILSNLSTPLSDIRDRDTIFAHRLPVHTHDDANETIDTILVHRKGLNQNKTPYSHVSPVAASTMVRFGFPWIVPVTVPKGTKAGIEQARYVEATVEKYSAKYTRVAEVEQPCSPSTSGDLDGTSTRRTERGSTSFKLRYTNKSASASFEEYGSSDPAAESHETSYTIGSSMHCVAIDWSSKALSHSYDEELFEHDVEEHSSVREISVDRTSAHGTPLAACVEAFIQEEPLGKDDMWYCRQCQEHVPALKKLDLWRMPPVLVMHLKRFSYSRIYRDKIDTLVDFPLNNLDMSPYVLPNASSGPAPIYDLYAVVNHFGGMGGGHYTAYTRHAEEGTWHLYDDSHCTPVEASAALNNSAAYVLFYKRRDVPMKHAMSRHGSLCNLTDMNCD